MLKAYRFRFYPTPKQTRQLAHYFGAARWVWNQCLSYRSFAYNNYKEKITGIDFSRDLTLLKKIPRYKWLTDTPAVILTQSLRDQDTAFSNFFAKRAKYPNYKLRQSAQSIRFTLDQRVVLNNYRSGQLLKLTGLGKLDVRWSRLPVGIPKMVTVSRDAAYRFFISFACEEEIQHLPETHKGIGIDLGIKDILVSSDGYKSGNPRHLNKKIQRLKRYQRQFARCDKGSQRRKKAQYKVAKWHAKIKDARKDWINKKTTEIIKRADIIALEDLHVKGMVKNHHLARALSDVGLGEIRRQIEYKAKWYGRQVIIIDRWAPTSKLCSECGYLLKKMTLSIREWKCPECGAHHDRDTNAARNILALATGGVPERDARGGWINPNGSHCGLVINVLAPDESRSDRNRLVRRAVSQSAEDRQG